MGKKVPEAACGIFISPRVSEIEEADKEIRGWPHTKSTYRRYIYLVCIYSTKLSYAEEM